MIKELEIFHDALELDGEVVTFSNVLSDITNTPIKVEKVIWDEESNHTTTYVTVFLDDKSFIEFQMVQAFDDFFVLEEIPCDIKEI